MTKDARRLALALLLAAAACTGPATHNPASVALNKVGFADLPGWQATDLTVAQASFRRGCVVLAQKADTAAMGGAGYAGMAGDWRAVCAAKDANARAFFETRFTPYRVNANETGLFTGYYEPEIAVSATRGGRYQTPVYGMPSDLLRADLGAFIPSLAGQHITGRIDGGKFVPYAARSEIDAHGVPAPVLFYAADPIALFFLQIQGSGRARLPDGHILRLSYAGANGQPYTAIGRTLIERGALTRENVSMQSIRDWLLAHPAEARGVMETDHSYVFLAQGPVDDPALGSSGTLGAPLTPFASLAIDSHLHALGAPFFVTATGTDPVTALLIAEDTGGAIKGAVRGDIFFGPGAEAERRAGALKAPGTFFVLLPNAIAARLGDNWQAPS